MRFSGHASAVNDTMQRCITSCAVSTRECSCQRPTLMRSSVLHIRGARCENRHLAHHDASPASGSSVLSIRIMLTAVAASYASLNFEACMIRCERKRQKLILVFTFGAVRGPPPHLFAFTPKRQQKYVFLCLGQRRIASSVDLPCTVTEAREHGTRPEELFYNPGARFHGLLWSTTLSESCTCGSCHGCLEDLPVRHNGVAWTAVPHDVGCELANHLAKLTHVPGPMDRGLLVTLLCVRRSACVFVAMDHQLHANIAAS